MSKHGNVKLGHCYWIGNRVRGEQASLSPHVSLNLCMKLISAVDGMKSICRLQSDSQALSATKLCRVLTVCLDLHKGK